MKTEPRLFDSYEQLVATIAQQMPDEYPEAMARVFADQWLKDGSFKIRESNQMKVSQLITDLQRVLENEGDIKVALAIDDINVFSIGLAVDRTPGFTPKVVIHELEYNGN